MKHIMFEYVTPQKQMDFPELEFDHNLNLSTYKGKIFIKTENNNLSTITKTFSEREADDDNCMTSSNSVIALITKTKIARESDDDCIDNNNSLNPIYLGSKTNVSRESDDE